MERNGSGDGRVYHISFRADDGHGECEGTVTVCVPLEKDETCLDGGDLFDSTSPTCDGVCGDICNVARSLVSASCIGESLPLDIDARIRSARGTLARAASTRSEAQGKRLVARAARLAHAAAILTAKAEARGALSSQCAEMVEQALGNAETRANELLNSP